MSLSVVVEQRDKKEGRENSSEFNVEVRPKKFECVDYSSHKVRVCAVVGES